MIRFPNKELRISHYNTHAVGGSAIVMQRLHQGLLELGIQSRMKYGKHPTDRHSRSQLRFTKGALDRAMEGARYSIENRMLRQPPKSFYSRMALHCKTPLPEDDLDCDLIHLHWVGRWLDLPSFFASIPDRIPVVWSIHDMSPLAGGCFTDFGCPAYGKGCAPCPLLYWPFNQWLAASELRRRRAALKGRRMLVAANSQSTRTLAERSEVFAGLPVTTIYPGLELEQFLAYPKHDAKVRAGLHPQSLVVGFGAASLTDGNKGLVRVRTVMEQLRANDVDASLVLFGDGAADITGWGYPVRHLGPLGKESDLSWAYSAMDVFFLASEMETFGQVSVEAQACGTPVCAFRVGGVSETLEEGVTGFLFDFARCNEVAEAIGSHWQSGRLTQMSDATRRIVEGRFSSKAMTESYLRAYNELLEAN